MVKLFNRLTAASISGTGGTAHEIQFSAITRLDKKKFEIVTVEGDNSVLLEPGGHHRHCHEPLTEIVSDFLDHWKISSGQIDQDDQRFLVVLESGGDLWLTHR